MIEVEISKPVAVELTKNDHILKPGLVSLSLEDAMDLEQVTWRLYKELGKTALARACAALSRNLATAIECTRSIQAVEAEINVVLQGKWDDEDAVETHLQLMVHRGWDRAEALKVVRRLRP